MLKSEDASQCDVLIVDDEPEIRSVIAEILSEEGFKARQAANGADALNVLAEAPPAVILLDHQMPKMDGAEFLAKLAQVPRWKVIPVIMISATVGALIPGVVELLRKPFDLDALVASVRRAVGAKAAKPTPA